MTTTPFPGHFAVRHIQRTRRLHRLLALALLLALGACSSSPDFQQISAPLDQTVLATAQSFAVLGGQTVTNTGPTTVNGNLGVSPGTSVTGFPPGTLTNGTIHAADAVALQAQADTTAAYLLLASETPTVDLTGTDLGGLTLVPGVYRFSSAAQLTGALTLDAGGDPSAVFVFQIGSTLMTASNSSVLLQGGATECNVFWQVGSSAVLGTTTSFKGNILALTSITLTSGVTLSGRVLARNGAVTMDGNNVAIPSCTALGNDAGPNPIPDVPVIPDAGVPIPDVPVPPDAGVDVDAGIPTDCAEPPPPPPPVDAPCDADEPPQP
jgi:hypothetical protein